MTRPTSHLFEVAIEVELPSTTNDKPLQFQMPKWSPGRYAVFDFAKNVQEFRAFDGICTPTTTCANKATRTVTRADDQTWSVATSGSTSITVSYKVFANDLSGTFSQLDERHANYNGGSIFMYVVDHKPDPVKLTIQPPAGWKIVNGRMDRAGQTEWQFPNWDIMIDTPTEIAPDWALDGFEVDGKKYHVMVHSFGSEGGKRAALAIVDTLDNARTVECAGVARLAAAGRIKRGAIEHDGGPATDAVSDVNHSRFKLDQVRVGVVKTFSHRHRKYLATDHAD
jgi:predicted metalloprotease with PDZ domain